MTARSSKAAIGAALLSAAALLALDAPGALGASTPCTWTGSTGSYSDALQWSCGAPPCNDASETFDVVIPDGAKTLTMDVSTCTVDTVSLGDSVTFRVPSAKEFHVEGNADVFGYVDVDGGVFHAPIAAFPGERARLDASAGGLIHIGATSYSSTGLNATNYDIIQAAGPGTRIELPALASLDVAYDDASGYTTMHRIIATSSAVIDLSALTSLTLPVRREDKLNLYASGGATIEVTALATIPGQGGRTAIEAYNGSTLSFPALTRLEDASLYAEGGASILMNGPQPIEVVTRGLNWTNFNVIYAVGTGTSMDLSSIRSIDAGYDDGVANGTWQRVLAVGGATIDFSSLTDLTMPLRREDQLVLYASGGSSMDLGALATIPGAGGRTSIEAYTGATLSFPALTRLEDASLYAEGGASILMNGPQPVDVATTGLDWTNFNIFHAVGSGTTLDLSSIVSIDAGYDDGTPNATFQRVIVTSGALADLSGLTDLAMPQRREDQLILYASGGGSIGLSSLTTIPGAGGRTKIEAYSGSTLSLPSLTRLEDTTLYAEGGASILVNGPQPVSVVTTGLNWTTFNVLHATGAGTVLDLSSVVALDLGYDDSTVNSTWQRTLATGGAQIDLSSLTDLALPIRREDWLYLYASGGASIDLSSLVTIPGSGGRTVIEAYSGSTLSFPSLTRIEDTTLYAEGGASILMQGPAPVSVSTTGLDWTNFNLFYAIGAGTSMLLPSIASIDAGYDDGTANPTWHRAYVSGFARLDLSGLEELSTPQRSEDSLHFTVSSGGEMLVEALPRATGGGKTRWEIQEQGEIRLGDFQATTSTSFFVASSGVLTSGSLTDDPATGASSSINLADASARARIAGSLDLGDAITLSAAAGAEITVERDLLHAHVGAGDFSLGAATLHLAGQSPQVLEAAGADSGAARPGGENLGIGRLVVGEGGDPGVKTLVRLVDEAPNGGGGAPEALYLLGLGSGATQRAGLRIHKDSTLSLGCVNTYVFEDDADTVGELLNDRFSVPDVVRVIYDQGFVQLDVDTDGDLFPDCMDNCPRSANADQLDADGDGVGDACQKVLELEDPALSELAEGLGAGSETGTALAAAGDLDRDGFRDFISGAPAHDPAAELPEAGAALVYLGAGDTAARTTPDIVFLGESAHDRAGVSVAGDFDFDSDGTLDLLIGAEQVDRSGAQPSPTGAGKVYLVYFDPADYPNLSNPAVPDTIDLARVGVDIPGVVFTGGALGDRAGFALAGGGRMDAGSGEDILIGAPGRDARGLEDSGSAYVIFDDPALSGTVSLSRVASGLGDEVAGVVFEGAEAGDELGYALAFPGDVLGDSGDDFGMGAPGRDTIYGLDAGIGYIGEGGSLERDISEVCDIGDEKKKNPKARRGTQLHGTQPGERFGSAIAGGGDNLSDGNLDLLIGAPLFDDGLALDAGRVIQTGARIPLGKYSADDVGAPPNAPASLAGRIWVGAAADDRFGSAVAGVGDVTGNGFDDIALGAPRADPAGLADAGLVYLMPGGVPPALHQGTIRLSEGFPGTQLAGSEAGERAGTAIAGTGDISGDGEDDFVVGAPGRDSMSLGLEAGLLYLVLGVPCQGSDADIDGVLDCLDNCPAQANPAQVDQDADGIGDACDNCPLAANPGQENPDRDHLGSACDNCVEDPNDSQRDRDVDGVGDACDTNPVFVVNLDPAEGADYTTVQQAIDNTRESGTRIAIEAGASCHAGASVDREQVYTIVGVDRDTDGDGTLERACIDGNEGTETAGVALELLSTYASTPIRVSNLRLIGQVGIRALVASDIRDVRVEGATTTALDFDGGAHRVERVEIVGGPGDGIDVAAGATLALSRSRIVNLSSGKGLRVAGEVAAENLLLADTNGGIELQDAALTLRHATIADSGAGIEAAGASTAAIAHTIFWNNAAGDLLGVVGCADVSWSDICSPDCSGQDGNICADPLFEPAGFELSELSPALDHGPDPLPTAGDPCLDLPEDAPTGLPRGPRLRDHDEDGLARVDIGAFERDDVRTPPEVRNLAWDADTVVLRWEELPGLLYHAYRDEVSALGYGYLGAAHDELIPGPIPNSLADPDRPDPGGAWFYLVTSDDGTEGSLGLATCSERCHTAACHSPP